MNELAKRLRTAREQAGLSQGQAAKLLSMHRPTISEIEAGRRKVSAKELTDFASIYEVSVTWLTNTAEDSPMDERVLLAARKLSSLRKEDLDAVLAFLSSLRDSEDEKK